MTEPRCAKPGCGMPKNWKLHVMPQPMHSSHTHHNFVSPGHYTCGITPCAECRAEVSPSEPAVWPPSTVPTQFPYPDKPAFARRNAEAVAPEPKPEQGKIECVETVIEPLECFLRLAQLAAKETLSEDENFDYCSMLVFAHSMAERRMPELAEPVSVEAFMSVEEFWKARQTKIILLVDAPIEAQYAAIFQFAEAYKNSALEHERRKNNKKI